MVQMDTTEIARSDGEPKALGGRLPGRCRENPLIGGPGLCDLQLLELLNSPLIICAHTWAAASRDHFERRRDSGQQVRPRAVASRDPPAHGGPGMLTRTGGWTGPMRQSSNLVGKDVELCLSELSEKGGRGGSRIRHI
jgi:hypothetical protein